MSPNLLHLRDSVEVLLEEASLYALTHFRSDLVQVESKADASPVTTVDRFLDALFQRSLPQIFPAPVISEESPIVNQSTEYCWLVDPLDGTKNYVDGHDEFSINVALMRNAIPILGLIAVPTKSLIYSGANDQGASKREFKSQTRSSLPLVPLKEPSTLPSATNRTLSSAAYERFAQALDRFSLTPEQVHRVGSAYKFCLLAEGQYQNIFYIGTACEWDIAAAEIIISESGGKLVTLDTAEPWVYLKTQDLRIRDMLATRV